MLKINDVRSCSLFLVLKAGQGGAALLAKHPHTLLPVGREAEASQRLWEGGRWNRAVLPIHVKGAGHHYLHLISAYCHSGFDQITHTQREQMIEDMFMDASAIGNQPAIISVDINTTDHKSTAARQALASGHWTDAATLFATDSDPPTYVPLRPQMATRPHAREVCTQQTRPYLPQCRCRCPLY